MSDGIERTTAIARGPKAHSKLSRHSPELHAVSQVMTAGRRDNGERTIASRAADERGYGGLHRHLCLWPQAPAGPNRNTLKHHNSGFEASSKGGMNGDGARSHAKKNGGGNRADSAQLRYWCRIVVASVEHQTRRDHSAARVPTDGHICEQNRLSAYRALT